jgi:hypothetical protein
MTRSSFRPNAICALAALPVLFALGSNSQAQGSASAGTMDLSGAPVMSDFWGTRMPRVCARVTTPPSAAQATALVQCHMDRTTREFINLMQNIKIQMTGSRAANGSDTSSGNFDLTSKIYQFRGSNDYYTCAPINESVMHNTGKNCAYTRAASTTGSCWKMLDGSYQCEMSILVGPEGRANTWPDQPGPTTY